jgi:hypothetical protein
VYALPNTNIQTKFSYQHNDTNAKNEIKENGKLKVINSHQELFGTKQTKPGTRSPSRC